MATLVRVQPLGNQMVAVFSDGSRKTLVQSLSGFWVTGATGHANDNGDTGDTATGSNTPGTVSAPVNDYPWKTGDPNSYSPLRYAYRNCTDFVAWRINRDHGVKQAPWKYTWAQLRPAGGDGDAIGWYQDWKTLGWNVDITPVPGCIAYFGSSAGPLGHVAYVQAVTGGVPYLEQYNWGTPYAYSAVAVSANETPTSYLQAPP